MATIKDLPFVTRVRIAREHQFYVLMHGIFRAVCWLAYITLFLTYLVLLIVETSE